MRRRINISVDPATYDKLQGLVRSYGFSNACELVVAFVHILLDRTEKADQRRYDLPDPDGQYIDDMFNELGQSMRTPDGAVPVRHNNPQPNGKR